jgi:hypothetical protein
MIHVSNGYRGAPSKERYIEAGDYAEDDERLFGLAEYLLENGHAVRVAPEPKPEPEPDAPPEVKEEPKPKARRGRKPRVAKEPVE